MIRKVTVRYFKQFEDQEFDLSEHIVLAGPNNSGKTTLLQAIAVWQLALERWFAERGMEPKAKKRAGVPVTRKDFTAMPLREMKLLWTNNSFSMRKDEAEEGKAGYPRVMEIILEGQQGGQRWDLAFELRYSSSEQVYVKPSEKHIENLPSFITKPESGARFRVIHIPPFSGIGAEETHLDPPYQNLLIGQGKAGDILRNLLLEVYQKSKQTGWELLCAHIEEIFGYRLLPPQYDGRPYILCEYLRGIPKGKGKNGLAQLDIACAGSGFHQVLLLLAFFYARPSSVLLLDEPDAHLHVILQKQVYDLLRRIAAERQCQLIISTHAEVLIDNTSAESILSFYGKPHRLISDADKEQVREALKRLPATDLLLAEQAKGVLYVEGQSDFDLLRAWARVLRHPLGRWFRENPFWHSNQGRNPREARGHFFALRAVRPGIKGFLLLDGDNRSLPDHEIAADDLLIERWERYEGENYLIHPKALLRFAESRSTPLFLAAAEEYLRDQLPGAVYREPLKDNDYLARTPASKTLLPGFLKAAQIELKKQEYYLIAEQMRPEEIPPEVKAKLDLIAQTFGVE